MTDHIETAINNILTVTKEFPYIAEKIESLLRSGKPLHGNADFSDISILLREVLDNLQAVRNCHYRTARPPVSTPPITLVEDPPPKEPELSDIQQTVNFILNDVLEDEFGTTLNSFHGETTPASLSITMEEKTYLSDTLEFEVPDAVITLIAGGDDDKFKSWLGEKLRDSLWESYHPEMDVDDTETIEVNTEVVF